MVSSLINLIRPRREFAEGLGCLSVTALAMVAPYQNIYDRNFGGIHYTHLSVQMCLTDLAGPVFSLLSIWRAKESSYCLEFHPFYAAVYSYDGRNKQDSKQQFQQLKIVCAPAQESTGTSEPAWRLRLNGLPSESVLPHTIFPGVLCFRGVPGV
jgi:hypothetical protein